MYVAMLQLSAVVAESHSLKEKRMVVRRIKDRVRERAGVVMAEVGGPEVLDSWQRAELGCAIASGDRAKALSLADEVLRVAAAAAQAGGAEIVSVAREVTTFAGEAQPFDRGAAPEGDDWIPDAWREEADA